MKEFKIDYIIVGQGLAGTWLSHELLRRGHSVVVVNHQSDNISSRKAAGLYNPITGRKMVKTWRADDLFDHLEADYKALQTLTSGLFLHPKSIYRPFASAEDANDWSGRQADGQYADYIKKVNLSTRKIENIKDPFGGILLQRCGYVDLPTMLDAFKKYLSDKGLYVEELFDYSGMEFEEHTVSYKKWKASKIIFCEGPITGNPFWKDLPFRPVRGETIDIACDLQTEFIINHGVFMIPKDDFFTVGSTYDHKNLTYEPQKEGIENLKQRLEKIFSGSYRIVKERAGIRPATHDRKPYIGFSRNYGTIGIFNGFGTKGVSLSPYFAKHFADVLEGKSALDKEIDVQRVH